VSAQIWQGPSFTLPNLAQLANKLSINLNIIGETQGVQCHKNKTMN
jgi:hypothetical protein